MKVKPHACEAPVDERATPEEKKFLFDMTGARLEENEEEFTWKNWPSRMRMPEGADVVATGINGEPQVRGKLRGFAGVRINGSVNGNVM